jgi:hypothetical protein
MCFIAHGFTFSFLFARFFLSRDSWFSALQLANASASSDWHKCPAWRKDSATPRAILHSRHQARKLLVE